MSIFLRTMSHAWGRSFQQLNWSLISRYITHWLYHGISEGLNKSMQLSKALGCIREKWLVFEEPQPFREGIIEIIWALWYKKRAKATYWSCIWISFEHKLKSNDTKSSQTLEIEGKLAVSFSCPSESLHCTWSSDGGSTRQCYYED